MRRQHPWAYLAAAIAAALPPALGVGLLSLPARNGTAAASGVIVVGIVALVLAFAYLLPIAVLLRRLLLFRAVIMGVVGFVPLAAAAACFVIGVTQRMPDGSEVSVPVWALMPGVAFYGALGAASGVVFHFVFRRIAGNEPLAPGSAIDA